MNAFLDLCRKTVGADHVLTDRNDMIGHLTDWRKRFTGNALAVVKPSTTEEVAAIVRLCNQHQVPVVPQGGNTGLVLGSIPDDSGKAIVLSLTRLNRIRNIDPINNTMIAEAGCILKNVQDAATEARRLFPLRLASEGSCTVGGTLAANAGGTAVLRYGNARELCLGLEVVTPQGEIWSSLRGLQKDNSAYDLRDLFIGSEGTLGIITTAVLKLYSQPKAVLTALTAMNTPRDALLLLSKALTHCDAALTGFELMSNFSLQLVAKHFPQMYLPLPLTHPQYVLLELSDSESEEHALSILEGFISELLVSGEILGATVASSISQSRSIWQLRENISEAQALEGLNIKHDISVPPSRIAEFIAETDALLILNFPRCRIVTFGHLGDGNLHYNVSAPEGVSPDDFLTLEPEVNRIVYDSVQRMGGSIAAEHGVGVLKRDEIRRYLSDVEIRLMQSIKSAIDPDNLMNPGKVV
jgi:FAD/FMN-containing dehydrogenase